MNSMNVMAIMVCSLINCSTLDILYWKQSDQIRTLKQTNRRFYSTKEELELTKSDPRIDAKPCNNKQPLSVFILSAGHSKGRYFERREAQRNSWVPELKSLNVSIYFLIALNINQTVNRELSEESDKYQDMIQFSFIDAYYNLTLKTLSMIRWINKKCLTSSHILKVDDDVIVNSRLLLDKLSDFKTGIHGIKTCEDVPNRDQNNFINYTPYDCFPNDTIPCYLRGGAYMMAGNVTHTLMKTFDRFPYCVIQIEDVFWTGILSELAGIPRHSTSQIRGWGCTDVCPLFEAAVIFECNSKQQTEEFWSEWKNTSLEFCRIDFYFKIILIVVIVVPIVVFMGKALTFAYNYFYKNKNSKKTMKSR